MAARAGREDGLSALLSTLRLPSLRVKAAAGAGHPPSLSLRGGNVYACSVALSALRWAELPGEVDTEFGEWSVHPFFYLEHVFS